LIINLWFNVKLGIGETMKVSPLKERLVSIINATSAIIPSSLVKNIINKTISGSVRHIPFVKVVGMVLNYLPAQ
jgi:hypothetical protein